MDATIHHCSGVIHNKTGNKGCLDSLKATKLDWNEKWNSDMWQLGSIPNMG